MLKRHFVWCWSKRGVLLGRQRKGGAGEHKVALIQCFTVYTCVCVLERKRERGSHFSMLVFVITWHRLNGSYRQMWFLSTFLRTFWLKSSWALLIWGVYWAKNQFWTRCSAAGCLKRWSAAASVVPSDRKRCLQVSAQILKLRWCCYGGERGATCGKHVWVRGMCENLIWLLTFISQFFFLWILTSFFLWETFWEKVRKQCYTWSYSLCPEVSVMCGELLIFKSTAHKSGHLKLSNFIKKLPLVSFILYTGCRVKGRFMDPEQLCLC